MVNNMNQIFSRFVSNTFNRVI